DRITGDCTVTFVIFYEDGSSVTAREFARRQEGRWTHDIYSVLAALRPKRASASIMSLAKDYTIMKGKGLSLRVPEGCNYNEANDAFSHDEFGLRIYFALNYGAFDKCQKVAEDAPLGGTKLLRHKFLSEKKPKALLFEGELGGTVTLPAQHHLILVV